MNSAKPTKSAKSKTSSAPVKDLRPVKDAKGGAQKKEIQDPLPQSNSGNS